jgi:sugar lactone lactonase YvrE
MQAMYSIADVTTNEGQTVNKTGNWHDVLADRPHVALTASVGTIIKHDDGTWDWSYTPPDGPATQVVTITADDGEPNGTSSISFTLTVNNVAPHDLVISADPSTIDEGSSTTLTGSFVDPGVLDTHTVTIDWGDGSPKTTRQLPRGDREFSIQKPTPYADNKAGNAPYTITATVSDAVAVTYDLAGDWSDTSNPNGVWSYNSAPGVPINVHWDDYDPTADSLFIHPQPAWAYAYNPDSSGQSRHVPFWAKIVSETVTSPYWYYFDLPIGVVGMHGSNTDHANVAWTSPLTGRVQISGDTWLARKNIGRDAEWRILLNGVAITGGSLYHNDPYTSASPFQFAQGWGGSAALSLEVSEGDVIAVELYKSPTTPYGEVMGLDLRIVSESGDGGTTKATTEAIVSNVAPHDLAISASPSTIDEGSTTTLSGSFVDPGVLDAHTVTIDWGDGSPKSTREFGPGVLEFSIEKPTPYTDNKPHNEPYTITATVTGGEDAGPDREYELVRSFSAGGQPAGVDVDSLGNVWVADYGSSQVQQYAKSGTLLQSYGGGLLHPYDVAVSPLGTIWVADNFHYQVKEFSSPGTLLQTVGYFVQQPGPPGSFDSPTGVKVDASGNVWVTEDYNHRVQVFSSSGALIRSFGTAVPGDTAPSYPYDVAFTSSGSVWVVDIGTNAIKEFTSDGVFLRKFTDQFVYPLGIAIGASGNIFVADLGNRVVKEFTEDLQFLGSFGAFSDLRHINLDSSGHVWTADIGANLIQEFAPSGGGAAVTASTTAIVRNVPPTVDAGPDMRANEGDRVTFSGSFSVPGILDTHTIRWDFGDGTEPVYGTLTPTHVYADNGEYPVTLTVIDKDGEPGSDTLTVGARSRR